MTAEEKYLDWKGFVKDDELSAELDTISGNSEEIESRFVSTLSFGTAGLRGKLGAGSARMNIFTVRQATQGLADYLKIKRKISAVAIAYDTRRNSELFAKDAARVLAGNGIKVWLYGAPAPTPMLSYAVRERECDAGIVITASHNPPEYNGYKVYGEDGCQISPETAEKITGFIEKTDVLRGAPLCNFDQAVAEKRIMILPDSFWRRYYARVIKEGVDREHHCENDLKIVYTPLYGTGAVPVINALSLAGFGYVTAVQEQMRQDGRFPTCQRPNPELSEALALAKELAAEEGADLVLGTDPDCDRLGVMTKEKDGYRHFSGNEIGVILLDFIIRARRENGAMPENPVAVKSIVSTKLADTVAKAGGVEMRSVFTGFRFIGEVIAELEAAGEAERFIFGFEESCGYLTGGYVRDKDGVDAALMVCEAANYWKTRGKTLGEVLNGIYSEFGCYYDCQSNFVTEDRERISAAVEKLRIDPPKEIGGRAVLDKKDYFPEADMIAFEVDDGSRVIVRPSGTEPKLKVYYSVKAENIWAAKTAAQSLADATTVLLGF